jgi:hypothetical protein
MRKRLCVLLPVLCGVVLLASNVDDAASGTVPLVAGVHCGEERWAIKTLSDPDAGDVDLTALSVTVPRLRAFRRPSHVGDLSPRIGRVEHRTYRVTAALIEARHVANGPDEDRDIHLVIANPNDHAQRMIVEFPDVHCQGASDSPQKEDMRTARDDFVGACGLPTKTRVTTLSGTATITGVGFWDKIHGQRGRAPTGLELHPVLRFRSSDCGRT